MEPLVIHSGYFNEALFAPDDIVRKAQDALFNLDYDTIVCSGTSGLLVGPSLAAAFGKLLMVIRKPNDSSHATSLYEGRMGKRWIFVDDFVASGGTRDRVKAAVMSLCGMRYWSTEYLGSYLYQPNRFTPSR